MKLWLLKAREDLPAGDNPWEPPQEKNFGLVVRAATELRARELAESVADAENRTMELSRENIGVLVVTKTYTPWLLEKYSTCEELQEDGVEGVILIDNLAG